MDKREEILNQEHDRLLDDREFGSEAVFVYKPAAISAMDEYMKECCLELLDYMIKKEAVACVMVDKNGDKVIGFSIDRGKFVTKEQLFENFL